MPSSPDYVEELGRSFDSLPMDFLIHPLAYFDKSSVTRLSMKTSDPFLHHRIMNFLKN